jgi:hypothetical protein
VPEVELTADVGVIAGLVFGVAALIGAAIARDRQITRMITDGEEKLHARINDVRDQYVRRDDLDKHMQRWEKTLEDLRADMKEGNRQTNDRLDKLLVALKPVK